MGKPGRKKGIPNKNSKEVAALVASNNCDPVKFLCALINNDWKMAGYKSEFEDQLTPKGDIIQKPVITLDHRVRAALDIMNYIYPKRKALEHTGEITSILKDSLSPKEVETIIVSDPFIKQLKDRSRDVPS